MLSCSRVGDSTNLMKEFLYWFVRAKGILNLFPEIIQKEIRKEEEDQAGSTQYHR